MYFDVAMPLTLFAVALMATFLNEKVEGKLKGTLEERKFGVREAVLLIAAMSVTVTLIVFIPQMAVMVIFLFAYSMLLFIFTYIFSDFTKAKARVFCAIFLIVSFLVIIISLLYLKADIFLGYGALAFSCLFGFAFIALIYEESGASVKERWYLAVLPPALFILLYIFYSRTSLWFPYLLNLYGALFAVLIILYLGSLFTWKASLIFVGLITLMDIVLVLFTGSMVSAARHVSGLRLPILISLPIIPIISTEQGIFYMSLGLGDFFFTGLISLQTMKKFGKKLAFLSIITMSISFFIFATLLLNSELVSFPGTLMIVCGWFPILIWKMVKH